MMSSQDSFNTAWLGRLADPQYRDSVASRIVDEYVAELLNLIQKQLSDKLAARIDSEDILQNVWASFFRVDRDISSRDELIRLLAAMCLNKSRDAARRHTADKRSVDAQQSLDQPGLAGKKLPALTPERVRDQQTPAKPPPVSIEDDSELDRDALELMSLGAEPGHAMIAMEFLKSLPQEQQKIVAWRVEGLTVKEIAEKSNFTTRAIDRRIVLIKAQIERFGNAAADSQT